MSMQRIFKYISSLIICILSISVQAQKTKVTNDTIKTPLFNGFILQVDLASVASSLLSNGVTYSYEGAGQVD